MRAAIITQLKTISAFGNRCFQPYLAPSNTTTPYCVVKMGEESPTPENFKGSKQHFEVYIYGAPSSFITLDALVLEVKQKLDKVILYTDESPARYFMPEYERTLPDFKDDERNLLMKTLYFNYAMCRH
jgi:hypothetical protein